MCSIYPGAFNEYKIKLLKNAGCILVYFGIQSGVERIRNNYLNRKEKNMQIMEMVKNLKKYNISISIDHIDFI